MSDFYLEDFSEVKSIGWDHESGTLTVCYKYGGTMCAFALKLVRQQAEKLGEIVLEPMPGWTDFKMPKRQ